MKVLLLGSTGNLGRRLLPALLSYNHTVTILVLPTSTYKLPLLFSSSLLSQIQAIEQGDATSASDIKGVIEKHGIDGIIDVAGNQKPGTFWKEKRGDGYLLEKIARAVSTAAVEVGRERGRGLRVWVTAGCEFILPFLLFINKHKIKN